MSVHIGGGPVDALLIGHVEREVLDGETMGLEVGFGLLPACLVASA